MKKLGILCVLATSGLGLLASCEKDQFTGAEAEVGKEKINPDMPKIPSFDIPPAEGDEHSVRETNVRNRKYFAQQVNVKGVVTWIYDCMTDPDVHTPDLTDDELKKIIDEPPHRSH